MAEAFAEDRWLSAVESARILGCVPKRVPRLAAAGHITVRKLPGCDPRYLGEDVARLARESVSSATVRPPGGKLAAEGDHLVPEPASLEGDPPSAEQEPTPEAAPGSGRPASSLFDGLDPAAVARLRESIRDATEHGGGDR